MGAEIYIKIISSLSILFGDFVDEIDYETPKILEDLKKENREGQSRDYEKEIKC